MRFDSRLVRVAVALTLMGGSGACTRAPLKAPDQAMRLVSSTPELRDDLPLEPLIAAVAEEIVRVRKTAGSSADILVFGPRRLVRAEYVRGLERFLELAHGSPTPADFLAGVRREFDFYEVYGPDSGGTWGSVFVTSYYEPRIPGSKKSTARFSQPLYRAPRDLLRLDLAEFDPKYGLDRKLRARLDGARLLPYFTREEIDAKGRLRGRSLELCWVEPVDAFFLQIQGSGTVVLKGAKGAPAQELRLVYAEKNGQPYFSVGQFLKGRLPPERLNAQNIEEYLKTLPPDERQRLLNQNPSYVFFQVSEKSALTFLGTPAVDGRTIATDTRFFPKGALAFMEFDRPRFDSPDAVTPTGSDHTARFVFDQDAGGAITGGGRVDLFWGRGEAARRYAGSMKHPGKLYYLVPKP